jgi:hypothetical protein
MGDRIEALLARCNRHPSMSDMVPLCLHELQQAEEFQTVPITGSQRLHVTCEGLTAFGYAVTPFDFQWPQRVGQEYLLTFLLALHQSVVCQELSWRSYSHRDGVRDNEALVKSYLEYVTQYESALASPQFNIQRLYRCSRTALGVERISHEVREELAAWMENEQRREQGTLNSMALGAVLAGVATLFVGLPLSYFNNDSNVALFWGSGSEAPGLLWFWTPLALLAGMALARSSIRKHLGRVWTLVWGDSAARKRPRLRGRPTRSQEPT